MLAGVIHLPALPGSPRAALPAREIGRLAVVDARALVDAGFDAVVVENFGDAPFLRRVGAVTIGAMTVAALRVRDACPELMLGVNVLRNDAEAALAVACAVSADFIRVNVLAGTRVTDQGIVEGEAGALMRLRRALGVERVRVWADVDVKHSAPLGDRSIVDEAHELETRSLADAVLVTGEGTGRPVDLAKLRAVRTTVKVPLLAASGVTVEGLATLASTCDGVIVGSALRADGRAGGPVDPERARRFALGFRSAFAR